MLDFSAFFPGLHRELLRRGVDFSRGQMLRASVLTLVMVLAACAAPVHQAESGTAATTAAADTTNAEAVAPPIAAAGAHAGGGKLRRGPAGQVGRLRGDVPGRGDDQGARGARVARGGEDHAGDD